MMDQELKNHPSCYGNLESVFPLGADGLRHTPEQCMVCPDKTGCLRTAIKSKGGASLREEKLNRAYRSGTISFLERWSVKKGIWLGKKKQDKKS